MESRQDLEKRIKELETQVASLKRFGGRTVRKRARAKLFGLPVYDIAVGPDLDKGELAGHARGFFAIGDIATGVFAIGGLARGLVALGGIAIGVVSMGGTAIGLGIGVGGLGVGAIAIGGGAAGVVAIGGGAAGYYAAGGGAIGQYVLSLGRQDPEAEAFFRPFDLPLPFPMPSRVEKDR